MNGEKTNRMQCAEFEAMLTDALDGVLGKSEDARFQAHLGACSNCASLYGEAEAGLKWLSALKEDEMAEPPAMMVENILRATIGTSPIPKAEKETKSWWERFKETPILSPAFHTVLQPRFAMGFGMAFFSITMLLNVAGVPIKNIAKLDLRPAAIVTAYYETTGKIVKYWENIRFVYKMETQIRDLKNTVAPNQNNAPQNEQKKEKNDNRDKNRETSKVQEQGRDKNAALAQATADQVEGNGQRLQESGQRRSL